MNFKSLTPLYMYQLIILTLIFIVLLVITSWIYSIELRESMRESAPPPATKEDIERIYGQTVEISESDKARIEAIYGNE